MAEEHDQRETFSPQSEPLELQVPLFVWDLVAHSDFYAFYKLMHCSRDLRAMLTAREEQHRIAWRRIVISRPHGNNRFTILPNGAKDGPAYTRTRHGNLRTTQYRRNRRHGTEAAYGKRGHVYEWVDDQLEGIAIERNDNDVFIYTYRHNKRNGEAWITTLTGCVTARQHYVDDKRCGEQVRWREDGWVQGTCQNNTQVGMEVMHYYDGRVELTKPSCRLV